MADFAKVAAEALDAGSKTDGCDLVFLAKEWPSHSPRRRFKWSPARDPVQSRLGWRAEKVEEKRTKPVRRSSEGQVILLERKAQQSLRRLRRQRQGVRSWTTMFVRAEETLTPASCE